jgi:hypothetical protein
MSVAGSGDGETDTGRSIIEVLEQTVTSGKEKKQGTKLINRDK